MVIFHTMTDANILEFAPTSPTQFETLNSEELNDHERRMAEIRKRLQSYRNNSSLQRHSVVELTNSNEITNIDSGSTTNINLINSEYETTPTAINTTSTLSAEEQLDAQRLQELVTTTNTSSLVSDINAVELPKTTPTSRRSGATSRPRSRSRALGVQGTPRKPARSRLGSAFSSRSRSSSSRSNTTVEGDDANAPNSALSGDSANTLDASSDNNGAPVPIATATKRATRTQQRIAHSRRLVADRLSSHYLSQQSISGLQRDARPLALLVRTVAQTLRDVSLGRNTANTQLESSLCDMLYGVLEQWNTALKDCVAHMQRTQRFLEAMHRHLYQLTDSVDNIQASFLQRQCYAANAAGHSAILHGMIVRRQALENEQSSGSVRPTELWGNSMQVDQLPMFLASRAICATHAPNSFKGISVEFTPRRRNTTRASRRAASSNRRTNSRTKNKTTGEAITASQTSGTGCSLNLGSGVHSTVF